MKREEPIVEALRFRAEQMGWNDAMMARALGMQRSHYSEVMNGKRWLTLSATRKAFALGVPAKVLLAETTGRILYSKLKHRGIIQTAVTVVIALTAFCGCVSEWLTGDRNASRQEPEPMRPWTANSNAAKVLEGTK